MSKVEASSIPAILDAIVGITSANGDTHLDDESMRNVDKLEAVCRWVCDRIYPAYSGDYPKQCASAEKVANAVRRASEFIPDYMGIDRSERTCRDTDYDTESITCSECGEITRDTLFWVDVDGLKTVKGHRPRFCSNCGAKVVDNGA